MKRAEKTAQESQCRGSMPPCKAEVFKRDLTTTTNESLIVRRACLYMIVMRVLLKSGGTSLAKRVKRN